MGAGHARAAPFHEAGPLPVNREEMRSSVWQEVPKPLAHTHRPSGESPDHGARHKFGHQEPRVEPLPLRWSGDRSTAYRSASGATREFAPLDGGKQEHVTQYSGNRIEQTGKTQVGERVR